MSWLALCKSFSSLPYLLLSYCYWQFRNGTDGNTYMGRRREGGMLWGIFAAINIPKSGVKQTIGGQEQTIVTILLFPGLRCIEGPRESPWSWSSVPRPRSADTSAQTDPFRAGAQLTWPAADGDRHRTGFSPSLLRKQEPAGKGWTEGSGNKRADNPGVKRLRLLYNAGLTASGKSFEILRLLKNSSRRKRKRACRFCLTQNILKHRGLTHKM